MGNEPADVRNPSPPCQEYRRASRVSSSPLCVRVKMRFRFSPSHEQTVLGMVSHQPRQGGTDRSLEPNCKIQATSVFWHARRECGHLGGGTSKAEVTSCRCLFATPMPLPRIGNRTFSAGLVKRVPARFGGPGARASASKFSPAPVMVRLPDLPCRAKSTSEYLNVQRSLITSHNTTTMPGGQGVLLNLSADS
jgi:hypothetical protein